MKTRSIAAGVAAGLGLLLTGAAAQAQGLTVLPVNIDLAAGQLTGTLTVINKADTETSVQIRALAWSQPEGVETLTPSDQLQVSPPIATIPANGTQVVRLVLRGSPVGKEASYRILLDQIPPAAAAGTVRIALRLSIPVFAQPETRALSHVAYRIESSGGQGYLVAVNDGARHNTVRDLQLTTAGGDGLKLASSTPYILAGATHRWGIAALPASGSLHLTGHDDTGPVDQQVVIGAKP